jgi:NAD-dependent dihydropyrimidine dehydrogenase PreA subunit
MTKKYLLEFNEKQLGEPILADCILDTGVRLNVLRADADGNILIKFSKEDEKKVMGFLKAKDVKHREEKGVVKYDREKCIDCGDCLSICPTKEFSFDENKKLIYDEDKCVLCGLCTDACPRKALVKPEF